MCMTVQLYLEVLTTYKVILVTRFDAAAELTTTICFEGCGAAS